MESFDSAEKVIYVASLFGVTCTVPSSAIVAEHLPSVSNRSKNPFCNFIKPDGTNPAITCDAIGNAGDDEKRLCCRGSKCPSEYTTNNECALSERCALSKAFPVAVTERGAKR